MVSRKLRCRWRSLETAAARQSQAVFELGQQRARRKHRYPCGCQLDRQGQSVQPLADAHDGRAIGAGERKFGIERLSTIDEEATGVEIDGMPFRILETRTGGSGNGRISTTCSPGIPSTALLVTSSFTFGHGIQEIGER